MPRATKETKKDELKEEKKAKKSTSSAKKETTKKAAKKDTLETKKKAATKKSTTTKKKTSTKKESTSAKKTEKVASKKEKTTTKAKTPTKKVSEKKETKTKKAVAKEAEKESKASKTTSAKKPTKKATSKEDVTTKKTKAATTAKKATSKKSTTTRKAATKKETTIKTSSAKKKNTTAKTTKSKKLEPNIVAEYYDLPYRYNETIVKILYQTPNVLFVYWDISDDDRNNFVNQYGENFFNDTKPVLRIFNLTKNYNFEIDINDFANSWYINVNDANCDYKVELGRRPISYDNNINTDYIYVSSSNDIEFPNDHILLEELPDFVNFRNVKTNSVFTRDIRTLRLVGINKIYSVYDFYKKLYNDNILDELNNKKILNPSSTSSWSN